MSIDHSLSHLRRLLAFGVLLAAAVPAGVMASVPDEPEGVVASFEGRRIRLTDGWGEARACSSDERGTRCYRSEAEMDAAERDSDRGGYVLMADCSSSVRLYTSTGYGGNVLELKLRNTVISLSPHGFDNATSSYKIGACSAKLYDTTSGTGLYPGNTNAGAQASSMQSGWNNRIGSVYIS